MKNPGARSPKSSSASSSRTPSQAAIRRAVASSTAIETGQPVKSIESKLRGAKGKFRNLKLAR